MNKLSKVLRVCIPLLSIILVSCANQQATQFSESDLRVAALMPTTIARRILGDHLISDPMPATRASILCGTGPVTLGFSEIEYVGYFPRRNLIKVAGRPGLCLYFFIVTDVRDDQEAKDITLALKALGAKVDSFKKSDSIPAL